MKNIFVKTKNVKSFVSLTTKLMNANNNAPKMGLIYGEPGLGKTGVILWWSINQDAIIVTAKNGMSARWFLSDLVEELGETPRWNSADLFKQATAKLAENPRMLIVDEIDYLINNSKAIETIRDLHDKTGIPVLLVGMGVVDKKLSRYKHLFDRIIEIYKFVPFDLDDVKLIIKTLAEVEIDDEVILYIHKNANRLRQIIKFLTKIENIAKTNDYKVITKKELGV
ncbi:AAA family ATPase [bacterium]|nr:AAA family ATPase [bacterium]